MSPKASRSGGRGPVGAARGWRAAALALPLLACGCGEAEPLRYFLLTASADPSPGPVTTARERLSIGLQPVELADYLDRQEIVTRRGTTAIRLADFDRWGEQLDVQAGRVIAQNLQTLVPGAEVFLLPTSFVVAPERELVVEIDRFDADDTGLVRLWARWQLSATGTGRVQAERRALLEERAADGSADAIALAMSRALGSLSQDIARAIR